MVRYPRLRHSHVNLFRSMQTVGKRFASSHAATLTLVCFASQCKAAVYIPDDLHMVINRTEAVLEMSQSHEEID